MGTGVISAQQFEKGAQSFAQCWEACSNAEQLWTWVAPDNKLVGQFSHHCTEWYISCGIMLLSCSCLACIHGEAPRGEVHSCCCLGIALYVNVSAWKSSSQIWNC